LRLPRLTLAAGCLVLAVSTPLIRPPADLDAPRVPPALRPVGSEPPATLVITGDPAPDVTWEGPGSRPQRLRDLRAQGHVLLVFFPNEAQMVALERDRDHLLDLRVVTAVVLDRSAAAAARIARRLDLRYTIVPDPRGVIAAQFNALDPATLRGQPCWFIVDRWGRVRGLDRRGIPEAGYPRLASNALVLPAPGVALPGSTR
jgi:peroxiredoxin